MNISIFQRSSRSIAAALICLICLLACDSAPELTTPILHVSTLGERVHESLVFAQEGQFCEYEKRQFLEKHKQELVQNVDYLLKDAQPLNQDINLINKRLHWLENSNIESHLEQFAAVLREKSSDLGDNIAILIPDYALNFPSPERMWNTLQFLRRGDIRILETRIREGVSNETLALFKRLIARAQSEDALQAYQTLTGEMTLALPNTDKLEIGLQLIERDDVWKLAEIFRDATFELLEPTRDETQELIEIVRIFTDTLPVGVLPTFPNEETIWNSIQVVQSEDAAVLIRNLRSKDAVGKVFEVLDVLKPVHAFLQKPAGKHFLKYVKGFISDPKTRQFMLDFAQFANGQRGWFERYFVSFCLGDSWTSHKAAQEVCVARMRMSGLDADRSRELLDEASILFKAGIIDTLLNVETLASELSLLFESEMVLAKSIASELGHSFQARSRADIEGIFNNPEHATDFGKIFDAVFDGGLLEASLRCLEISRSIYANHQPEARLIESLLMEARVSLVKITREQIAEILSYVNNDAYQNAFKHLYAIASEPEVTEDLNRLYELCSETWVAEAENIGRIKQIASDLGIPFGMPKARDISQALAYVGDEKNQMAAKSLALLGKEIIAEFAQVQEQFATFPGERINYFSESSRDRIYSWMDQITKDDVQAISDLTKLSYDLWSMSSGNLCQPSSTITLSAKDFGVGLARIGDFLTAPEQGLKSWLSLFRRIAADTPAS